ncbi:MAG TPA: hypothetical protein VJY62_01940 [Bacteroidia bacterium]|nr:hypothetical protein [Bacteroidia bacterium]
MKKIIIPFLAVMLVFTFTIQATAQDDDIGKIIEQIKVSYEMDKLNDCRIRLRAIDFSKLNAKEKEQYAEAYKQLALAFRNHRYSRPAYDIYEKYLALRETILIEEKNRMVAESLKKHADLNASVLEETAASEKERKMLLAEKSTLDGIKKNNFRYSVIFTIALLGIFFYIVTKYNSKLKAAKSLLHSNRRNIFEKSDEVTRGQMSLGVVNRLKFLNEEITDKIKAASVMYDNLDKELKGVKEAEQHLAALRENISQTKQLSEISSGAITNVLRKISGT